MENTNNSLNQREEPEGRSLLMESYIPMAVSKNGNNDHSQDAELGYDQETKPRNVQDFIWSKSKKLQQKASQVKETKRHLNTRVI